MSADKHRLFGQRPGATLLLAAMALRALVPDGYMIAAPGGGSGILQPCPVQSAALVAVLDRAPHAHHGGADHGAGDGSQPAGTCHFAGPAAGLAPTFPTPAKVLRAAVIPPAFVPVTWAASPASRLPPATGPPSVRS